MRTLLRIPLALAAAVLGLAVLLASPASAGGWALSTLDAVPEPVAGQDVEVGFTVRQHGRTPVDLDDAGITIRDASGAETFFAARHEGPTGHHVATVRFPAEGAFTWQVDQGWFGPQDLGTIDVLSPGGVPAPAPVADAPAAVDEAPQPVTVRSESAESPLAVRLLLPAIAAGAVALAAADLVATRRRHTPATA